MAITLKNHYLNIGPKGTFQASGQAQSLPRDIDEIIRQLEDPAVKRLAIHFHGGLVPEKKGLEIAANMAETYSQSGVYALSIIWETGLLETIQRNLDSIHNTELFQKLLDYLVKVVSKRLGIGGDGKGAGEMDQQVIDHEMQKEQPFAQFEEQAQQGADLMPPGEQAILEQALEAELMSEMGSDPDMPRLLAEEAPRTELLDYPRIQEAETEGGKGGGLALLGFAAKVAYKVIKRYLDKRNHGFFPTIVEELLRELYLADLGKWVWDGIKAGAQDQMWLPNDGLSGENLHAGSYLLEKLNALNRPDLAIDLSGHSAGSIAICQMLHTVAKRYPKVRIRNLYFLAPACTCQLFYDEVVSKSERFQGFRLFTMKEENEKRDRLAGPVYPWSLLYFVSGLLEDETDKPLLGLHRHLQNKPPYDKMELLSKVRAFIFDSKQKRAALSETDAQAPEGLRTTALKHGDFDEDKATLQSLAFLLSQ